MARVEHTQSQWLQCLDEDRQEVYWYHTGTGKSVRRRPEGVPGPIHPFWRKLVDADTGKVFFFNTETKEVSYSEPLAVASIRSTGVVNPLLAQPARGHDNKRSQSVTHPPKPFRASRRERVAALARVMRRQDTAPLTAPEVLGARARQQAAEVAQPEEGSSEDEDKDEEGEGEGVRGAAEVDAHVDWGGGHGEDEDDDDDDDDEGGAAGENTRGDAEADGRDELTELVPAPGASQKRAFAISRAASQPALPAGEGTTLLDRAAARRASWAPGKRGPRATALGGAGKAAAARKRTALFGSYAAMSGNLPPVAAADGGAYEEHRYRPEDWAMERGPSGAWTCRRRVEATVSVASSKRKGLFRLLGRFSRRRPADEQPGTAQVVAVAGAEPEEEEAALPREDPGWARVSGNCPVLTRLYHRSFVERTAAVYDTFDLANGEDERARARCADLPPTAATIRVHVCTWNVGNACPPPSLSPWVPRAGAGVDLVVVGLQEAQYAAAARVRQSVLVRHDAAVARRMRRQLGIGIGAGAGAGGAADGEDTFAEGDGVEDEDEEGGDAFEDEDEDSEEDDLLAGAGHFLRTLRLQLGDEFAPVAQRSLGQMRVFAFARTSLLDAITDVETADQATGLGNVMTNKGGIVLRLRVFGAPLAFVSCHLAAHEGAKYLATRNRSCGRVLRGARVGDKAIPVTAQAHHVFWLGDLNYRVDAPGATHEERWDRVKAAVDAADQQQLLAWDELRREIAVGRALAGFSEPPPAFAPTFKVERRAGTAYLRQRLPSFTDRVLSWSMPGWRDCLERTAYAAHPSVETSDHKPVSATFAVTVPALPTPPRHAARQRSAAVRYPTVHITGLRATGLRAADSNGQSDPYVVFAADPPTLLAAGPLPPRTAVCTRTLDPVWRDDTVPPLRCRAASLLALAQAHLVLRLRDEDKGQWNEDDELGVAVVALREACTVEAGCAFAADVVFDGVPRGRVEGHIRVAVAQGPAPSAWAPDEVGSDEDFERAHLSPNAPAFVRRAAGRGIRWQLESNRVSGRYWYNPLSDTCVWGSRRTKEGGEVDSDDEASAAATMDAAASEKVIEDSKALNEAARKRVVRSDSMGNWESDFRNGGPLGGVNACLPAVLISGFLRKYSGQLTRLGRRTWQRRFTVLRGNLLCYYKTREHFVEGHVPQRSLMVDVRLFVVQNRQTPEPSFSLTNAVEDNARVYLFATDDESTCEAWVAVLSTVAIPRA